MRGKTIVAHAAVRVPAHLVAAAALAETVRLAPTPRRPPMD
jgi:hypothetical protein